MYKLSIYQNQWKVLVQHFNSEHSINSIIDINIIMVCFSSTKFKKLFYTYFMLLCWRVTWSVLLKGEFSDNSVNDKCQSEVNIICRSNLNFVTDKFKNYAHCNIFLHASQLKLGQSTTNNYLNNESVPNNLGWMATLLLTCWLTQL